MTAVKTWTFDRHPKGDGPWTDEPDKVQWVDPVTDLDCLAVRNRMGAWCGYVGLPPGHALHGLDYDQVHERVPDLDVHGGLTFARDCAGEKPDGDGVCHVPEPGRPAEVWWLGFDCAHLWDLIPDMVTHNGHRGDNDVYRDLAYVQGEVASLARQLAAA